MADNYQANAGSGGSVFASDDIGGVHHPKVKIEWGPSDTASDPSVATPIPVQSSIESAQMMVGGVVVTPKFGVIAAASSGNNTLQAGVGGKKLRVLAATFMAAGSVNAKFQSGAGGTDLTGLFYLIANTGAVLPFNPAGWFETATAALLNLNLSAAIAVGGCFTYIEV